MFHRSCLAEGPLSRKNGGVGESASAVVREISDFLDLSIAAVELARLGLGRVHADVRGLPVVAESPDPTVYFGPGDPNDPASSPTTQVQRSVLLEDTTRGGRMYVQIGQQWVVATYSRWEDHFRPRLASHLGIKSTELQLPIFGDLRRLRHDVVHNLGFASGKNSAKRQVLPPLSPGQVIRVGHEAFVTVRSAWRDAAMTQFQAVQPPGNSSDTS